jgi:hypothetical protein
MVIQGVVTAFESCKSTEVGQDFRCTVRGLTLGLLSTVLDFGSDGRLS